MPKHDAFMNNNEKQYANGAYRTEKLLQHAENIGFYQFPLPRIQLVQQQHRALVYRTALASQLTEVWLTNRHDCYDYLSASKRILCKVFFFTIPGMHRCTHRTWQGFSHSESISIGKLLCKPCNLHDEADSSRLS